jgi:hypothetical protein
VIRKEGLIESAFMDDIDEKPGNDLLFIRPHSIRLRRIALWSLVAVYTIALPYAIIVYQSIQARFSQEITGKIPLVMSILLGVAYIFLGFVRKKGKRFLARLAPCAVIAAILISLEPNPNKQIHIPEYILMSWLVFQALALDYKGKGILALVFVISSMLGVVDELEQGIHSGRFFGWWDMIMNSASAGIGVILLSGLGEKDDGSWDWFRGVKAHKGIVGLGLFGLLGTVLACVYLFKVHEKGFFGGVYPFWLLAWNALFAALFTAMIFSCCFRYIKGRSMLGIRADAIRPTDHTTGYLWLFPVLSILFVINTVTVIMALVGCEFR